MRLTTLDEASIQAIGHAFGYYDYGKETGMGAACSSPDKTALYICGFVRAMLATGLLYTTSERGEAFIAYRLPGEKVKLTAFFPLLKGVFQAMTFRELCRFARLMKRAGASLNDRYDKEKKPHIYVGLVCVTEKYQGRGTCGRCWRWRSLTATACKCRLFWKRTQSRNATSMCI